MDNIERLANAWQDIKQECPDDLKNMLLTTDQVAVITQREPATIRRWGQLGNKSPLGAAMKKFGSNPDKAPWVVQASDVFAARSALLTYGPGRR